MNIGKKMTSVSADSPIFTHSRSNSFSNDGLVSRTRYSITSDMSIPSLDRDTASTPTNYSGSLFHQGSIISGRSLLSSHSTSDDDSKEIIVVADNSKNNQLLCPLCTNVFRNPFIATCGHTFCSRCLKPGKEELCPIDGIALSMVVRNLAVAEQVGELMIHCRYGCKPVADNSGQYEVDSSGCTKIVKLSNRYEHENECEYAPIKCPNSSLCPPVIRKNLNDHLKVCQHVRCPHHRFNCKFEGTHEELCLHLEQCKFEGLKGYLSRTDENIFSLESELKKKDDEIMFLRSMLVSLSEKVEMLEQSSFSKIGQLDDKHMKLQKDVNDARHGIDFVMNELQHVQAQLGVAGTMDLQHIFKCKGTFVGHTGPVWALCVIGNFLYSGSSDNTIKVWDTGVGFKCVQTLSGHDGLILTLCPFDDKYMYSGSADQSIIKWNIESFRVVATIPGHENPVCTLAIDRIRQRLYSGSLKSIKVWDTDSNTMIRELPAQNHWVRALVVSEELLYSGSYQAVKIWNLDTLECVRVLDCVGGSVYSLLMTSQYIACGTYENKINVWNIKTLESVGELSGHFGIVYALQAIETPGQTKLFSASYDKTLRVWNIEHMTCSQTLIRHDSSVTCLAMARGRLFSGSVDSTIKVWQ